ncbi:hypothetical protein [Salibacterium aidingense]|uniref:hypothetical protein n=1 Tax=Salibacterium aidingense TaxID=384933 RepID=UPI0005568FA6|nr:hypothetical protein [Salibacterium aidingense]
MKHYKSFLSRIHRLMKSESGHFLVFEWSKLIIVFMVLLFILMPDLISIGKAAFTGHNASSYTVQRVADQGEMTEDLAADAMNYMEDRGMEDCGSSGNDAQTCYELYGTGERKGINSEDPNVEVLVVIKHQPRILQVLPDLRAGNSLAVEDGVIQMAFHKLDAANPYIREN